MKFSIVCIFFKQAEKGQNTLINRNQFERMSEKMVSFAIETALVYPQHLQ